MLRNIWCELTCFDRNDVRTETEKDLVWFMEALCQRNQDYLARRPSTPRLYKSGVIWEQPKQLQGDIDEIKILKKHLGSAIRNRDVSKVLQKIEDVLGGEHFCDIGVILELGAIDCDGLACYRVAELRQQGIQARPFMTNRTRPDGGTTYHALVVWPPLGPYNYETTEDPSLLLGMYQPERAADRAIEIQKNIERADILRRYGRAALHPSALPAGSPFADAALDAAVEDLLGARRRRAA